MGDIYKSIVPFVAMMMICLAIMMVFPESSCGSLK